MKNNQKLIQEISRLTLKEQMEAYNKEHPEAYLLEKKINRKKEEIKNKFN